MLTGQGQGTPFFGPGHPLYPPLIQIVRVSGAASSGIYPCFTLQFDSVALAFRDREASYVIQTNGDTLANGGKYVCRLVGSYLNVPLYATCCEGGGQTGGGGFATVITSTTVDLPSYTVLGNVITATSNGALTNTYTDGVTPYVGMTLLITTGNAVDRGIYTVTQVGDGTHPFILTRTNDVLESGMLIYIQYGTQRATNFANLITAGTITPGTTPIQFTNNPIRGLELRTPATITSSQNNYDTQNVTWLKVETDAPGYSITGFKVSSPNVPVIGQPLYVTNKGTSYFKIPNESTLSSPLGRVTTSNGLDRIINPGETAVFFYDTVTGRWVESLQSPFARFPDTTLAQITGDQNNYAIGNGSFIVLSSDASHDITGLAGGTPGRVVAFFNGGGNNIVLKNNSGSSSAENRMTLPAGADYTLASNNGITLAYNGTTSLWDAISTTAAAGSGSIGGSGTQNTIPKFTPDGVTLGDSQITDDGSSIAIGPSATDIIIGDVTTYLAVDRSGDLVEVQGTAGCTFSVFTGTSGDTINLGSSGTSIGFFGASAVGQPGTTGTTTGFTQNGGTEVRDDSTFTGNVGTKAYTIGDIVKALKDLGLMDAS